MNFPTRIEVTITMSYHHDSWTLDYRIGCDEELDRAGRLVLLDLIREMAESAREGMISGTVPLASTGAGR